jgi:hypothetical protein
MADTTLKHAMHGLELATGVADLVKDFDLAHAYEGVARANALTGIQEKPSNASSLL